MNRLLPYALAIAAVCATFLACTDQTADTGAPTAGDDDDDDGSTAGDDDDDDDESCSESKVQSLGEPCCEKYGIDACGAGLFCAKLDGRTVATCYPNNVRKSGETCTDDIQCMSNTCSAGGECAASRNEECSPKGGCEEGYVCAAFLTDLARAPQCLAVGQDGVCLEDRDCSNGASCRSGHCVSADPKYAGESCSDDTECVDVTAGCFQGKCQCHKANAWGCPLGTTCGGGNHATKGQECN